MDAGIPSVMVLSELQPSFVFDATDVADLI